MVNLRQMRIFDNSAMLLTTRRKIRINKTPQIRPKLTGESEIFKRAENDFILRKYIFNSTN